MCVSFSGLLCLEIGKKKKEKEKEKKNEKKIIVVVVVIVSVAIFVYYVTFSLVNFRHYQHVTQKHIQISQLFHFLYWLCLVSILKILMRQISKFNFDGNIKMEANAFSEELGLRENLKFMEKSALHLITFMKLERLWLYRALLKD